MTTSITRILVTDDEPLALKAAAHLLKSAGYEIYTASNGEETLQLAEQHHPDVMLLDVILPDIEGTEICRRLKSDPHTADIFIILLSGVRIASDEQSEAMEGGADGYIVRPIAGRELLARIQAYLRVKNAEQRIREYSRHLEEVIAERKKGEDALRESENKYRSIYEETSLGIFHSTFAGRFHDVNPALAKMLGYASPQEVVDSIDNIAEQIYVIPPQREEIITRKLILGQTITVENRYRRRNGEEWDAYLRLRYVIDGQGKPLYLEGVVEDISERKRVEKALHESNSRYDELVRHIPAGVCVYRIRPDGITNYEYVSPRFCQILDVEPEMMLRDPETANAKVHPHDLSNLITANRVSAATLQPLHVEARYLVHSETRWIRVEAFPTILPNGDSLWNGMVTDITDRKQAEEALQESEVRFKSAFQYSAIGMALISPQGDWLKVNSRICEIVGYSETELLAKTFQDITHPDDLTADVDQVSQMLAGEIETYKMEKRYIHKKGHFVWALLAVSLVQDGDGTPLYFISQIEDITERKRIEKFSEVLYEISKAVYLTANVNELFQRIHRLLVGIIPGNNFFIALLTNDRKTISFPYSQDEKDQGVWPDIDVKDSQSLTVEVLSSKKPLLLNETQLQDRYLARWNKTGWGSVSKCWLGIPLMIRDKVIGVMAVQDYHNSNAYSQQDVSLLELAASQIAVAIERKQSEDALRASEERYRAVFDSANDAIISADGAGNMVDWNLGAARIFGYSEDEVQGQPITMLLPERYQAGHLTGMARIQANREKHVIGKTVELEGRRKDGYEFPLELSLSEWQVDGKTAFTAVIRDITERNRLKKALQQQASTDELTGIFNRRHFQQLAHRELKRAARLDHPLAIVLMDIDHFKAVNDTLGHAAGDQVLLAFTKICQRNIREIDVFARFGGDEFALLLPETNPPQAFTVVERIRMAITAHSIDLDGNLVSISISSGISNLSNEDETFDNLLSQADQALYRAKETGRNNVVQYVEL